MQRDHKIGLSLGILLVGAVAAFFFRNEAPPETLPRLHTAAELDQRIAERERSPYLQPSDAGSSADLFQSGDPWENSPGGLVPDPVPLEADSEPTAAATATELPQSNSVEVHHIVQRGETLSSIAARYLGSAARYQELYEANADRLRDANDLRVGMELRIPPNKLVHTPAARTATVEDRRTFRDGAAAAREAPQDSPQTVGITPLVTDAPVRFEPYRRSPLTPQGTEPPAPALDPKEAARRRLTQLPPRGDISPPR